MSFISEHWPSKCCCRDTFQAHKYLIFVDLLLVLLLLLLLDWWWWLRWFLFRFVIFFLARFQKSIRSRFWQCPRLIPWFVARIFLFCSLSFLFFAILFRHLVFDWVRGMVFLRILCKWNYNLWWLLFKVDLNCEIKWQWSSFNRNEWGTKIRKMIIVHVFEMSNIIKISWLTTNWTVRVN